MLPDKFDAEVQRVEDKEHWLRHDTTPTTLAGFVCLFVVLVCCFSRQVAEQLATAGYLLKGFLDPIAYSLPAHLLAFLLGKRVLGDVSSLCFFFAAQFQ